MTEKSHKLNQSNGTNQTSNHANHSFKKYELPTPIFVDKREEGEAKIAEHESFQGEPNYLKSS
jgi:hypothetical protein